MEAHLKSYLTNSTAHGLRYLVQRLWGEGGGSRSRVFLPVACSRTAWAVAITLSFAASAYLVATSLTEAHDHPVLTTTEYVPIQVRKRE